MRVIVSMMIALGISLGIQTSVAAMEQPLESPVALRRVDGTKVQLLYGANQARSMKVRIYDASKFLVKRENINAKNAFAKYYDFSQLKPGTYTVEVSGANNEVMSILEVIIQPETKLPVVYSKLEKANENAYKLLVNSLLPSQMTVYVFENDRLIHEETLGQTQGFEKLYRLQGIKPAAKVEFLVRTNDGFSKILAAK